MNQLPVNRPKNAVHNYAFDGQMWYDHTGDRSTYAPNSNGDSWSDETGPVDDGWEADGTLTREAQALRADDDDFGQAGTLVREVFSAQEREDFVETVAGALKGVRQDVQARAFEYWKNVDATIGQRIEDEVKRHEGDGIPGVEAGGEARI